MSRTAKRTIAGHPDGDTTMRVTIFHGRPEHVPDDVLAISAMLDSFIMLLTLCNPQTDPARRSLSISRKVGTGLFGYDDYALTSDGTVKRLTGEGTLHRDRQRPATYLIAGETDDRSDPCVRDLTPSAFMALALQHDLEKACRIDPSRVRGLDVEWIFSPS